MALLKTIPIPVEQRKKTTLANNLYYEALEIHDNRVIGYANDQVKMTWFFKGYNGIDLVEANLNSQFSQIVFLTGINSKNKVVGVDLGFAQNINAMNDTNKILLCSGMFSFKKTNEFANTVACEIRKAFECFANLPDENTPAQVLSAADEIKKFKDLLDSGVITQQEFDAKKKQLLGL